MKIAYLQKLISSLFSVYKVFKHRIYRLQCVINELRRNLIFTENNSERTVQCESFTFALFAILTIYIYQSRKRLKKGSSHNNL